MIVGILITYHIWMLSAPPFQSENLGRTWELWSAMATNFELGMVPLWWPRLLALCTPLLLMQAVEVATGDLEPVHRFPVPVRAAIYAALVAIILLYGEDFGSDFVYFQF